MAPSNLTSSDLANRLGSLLPALPPAALSTSPPESVLPLLTPILRQRVQFMSSSSNDPWIRLLCKNPDKAARLAETAQSEKLQLHPVSGEIEVDWDYDAEVRYRRVDEETLQALVALREMGLSFLMVYCVSDPDGGDGWKTGEVSVVDSPAPFAEFGGVSSAAEAERQFEETHKKASSSRVSNRGNLAAQDDDDDYWGRYAAGQDGTPARTPMTKRSPAPQALASSKENDAEEDDYYAQYDSVQPALDSHDPDEDVGLPDIAPPLGLGKATNPDGSEVEVESANETNGVWTLAEPPRSPSSLHSRNNETDSAKMMHPRPESSASSHPSVAKLEAAAENFAVQQHISRSIKSLFMLSRTSGMEREEFERIVKTELEMLGMVEDL